MEESIQPRPFNQWRSDKFDRQEDAACTFGNHLIKYCRDEVMQKLPAETTAIEREKIREAIHATLHNVMDMLEGFWNLDAGTDNSVEYALQVIVKNPDDQEVERVEISPCKVDLPIGFWKWAEDGEFR
jgi:hypothetical protein